MKLSSNIFSAFSVQERIYSGQQLAKLIDHPSTALETEWKTENLCFIMALTQFVLKEPIGQLVKTVPLSLSRDGRQELKETFFKALDVKVFVSKEVEGKFWIHNVGNSEFYSHFCTVFPAVKNVAWSKFFENSNSL